MLFGDTRQRAVQFRLKMTIKLAQAFREKMQGPAAAPQGEFYLALSALWVFTGLLTQACGPGWYVSRLQRSLLRFVK